MTRNRGMMAVSLLTIFLYSSLALGIIPFLVPENVSWQGHLAGAFAGIVLAFYFKPTVFPSLESLICLNSAILL